ncbi:hypothetical protein L3Q82_004859 [Scortum barcoo]|uniref:Uncharacterized protein n=1 Tax=Scortum barcoo TaxID=214431 RepID=A0ACB8VE68_9TELE|nr:hypothetical protein L3Q82_004859 [Scortum barcoo]
MSNQQEARGHKHAARPQSTKKEEEEEEKRLKRKREDEECHADKKDKEEEEERGEIKKVCLPVLRGYVAARRGERDEMQDAHVLLPDMSDCLSALPGRVSRVSYFAVFDGHGGTRASRFAAEHLHHNLAKKFPSGETENLDKLIKKCLLDTFRQTDEDFLKKASSQKPAWKDGSTATCLLVVDDMVYVANLGDSRAVLCRMEATGGADGERRSVTLALSKEHNPTIYEERMRIQRAGGTVRFIILACDGLFKVFSADEAVKFVLNVLQDGSVEQRPGLSEEELKFEAACQQLASEAVMKLCSKMVEAGQAYNSANQLFLSGLAELSMNYRKDDVVTNCLKQFHQGLKEMINFHTSGVFAAEERSNQSVRCRREREDRTRWPSPWKPPTLTAHADASSR